MEVFGELNPNPPPQLMESSGVVAVALPGFCREMFGKRKSRWQNFPIGQSLFGVLQQSLKTWEHLEPWSRS